MSTPSIPITLTLSPSNPTRHGTTTLTLTSTLSQTYPITICTWKPLFATNLSQSTTFTCTNLSTNTPVRVEM